MKNKLLLSSLLGFVLVSCGGETTPSTNSSLYEELSDVTSTNESTFEEVEVDNENLNLFMYGDLHMNGMRTMYAKLSSDYEGEEIIWETSKESIISASGREDLSSECLLIANDYGVSYIKASLKNHPEVYSIKKIEIKKGESMPLDLFASLTGSATLTTTDEFIMFDKDYKETITKTEGLEVIYEENDATNNIYTDAYQMTMYNKRGEVTKVNKYVRDENKKQFVATEYLDYRNNVRTENVYNSDEEKVYWDYSAYFNPLADSTNITNKDFETFDGGKTYHFVSYYTYMESLAVSLYLDTFSPDDIWFAVDGDNITLNMFIDPYNSEAASGYKYARRLTTEFSNLGTSVIDHLMPYESKNYHESMQNAIDSLKNNNYTVNYSITFKDDNSSIAYRYRYTDNAIDETIYNDGVQSYRAGYYKVDNTKFVTYEYDETNDKLTFTKTHEKNWETSSLYPTFDFAVEVFDEVETNSYETYENHALLLSRCIPLNDVYVFALQNSGKAYMRLNNDGTFTLSATFFMEEEEIEISATYSEIGTTSIGIDFSKGEDADLPKTWEEANSSLYSELVSWEIDDVVPYLYVKQNYEGYTGINGSMYAVNYVYFNTNLFDDEASRDQFISNYKNLLIENGFVEDGTNSNTGFTMYTKDGYSIGVGAETQRNALTGTFTETLRAQIIISSPFIVEAPWAD